MDIDIEQAIEMLLAGEVIGVPTDTVYGLSSLKMHGEKIFEVKMRDKTKKLVTMVSDGNLIKVEDEILKSKIKEVWPGAVTLIFEYNGEMTSFRVPNEPNLLALLQKLKQAIYTTSANISGEPPCLTRAQFKAQFPDIGLLKEPIRCEKSNVPSQIYIYQNNQFERIR